MPLFMYVGHDAPGSAEKRPGLRTDHFAHLKTLDEERRMRFAGPLLGEQGEPRGSGIIFEAESFEAARAIAEADPYLLGGVFERVEVFETKQVFPEA